MYHQHLYFVGGGRLLIAFLFFLSARVGFAQTGCTPFVFEICRIVPTAPWNIGSNQSFPGAFQAFYEVKLKTINGSPLPQNYAFGYLAFSGKISVNGFTSRINKGLTDQYSSQSGGAGPNPFFQYLQYDTENGEVTWVVGSALTGCMENGGTGTTLPLHNSPGNPPSSVTLFTIVIDALPGDVLQWSTNTAVDVQTCNGPGCIGNMNITGCGGNTAPFQIVMPAPPTCNPARTLSFSLQIINGFYHIIVSLSGLVPGQSVNKIDGVIHIQPNMNGISDLDFEASGYPNSLTLNSELRKNADGSFDVFFYNYSNIWTPINATENLLALKVIGQYNLSQGGDLNCSLSSGRGGFNNGSSGLLSTCSLQSVPATLNIPGFPLCDNKLKVSASRFTGPNCQLNIQYTLSFLGSNPLDFSDLKLKFFFILENGNNTPGTVSTTLPCSTCGALTQSPNNNKIWIYDYSYTQAQQGAPLILNNGTTITIPFTLNQDCIKYFVYNAEAKPTGSSSFCAFDTEIDLNQWPACNPAVQGSVIIDDATGTPAPFYKITLQSTIDANYSLVDVGNGNCSVAYSMCPDPGKAPFQLVASMEPGAGSQHCGCGVSTLDAALISKHVLGIQPLPASPYIQVAADVCKTQANVVSVEDIFAIRNCLLGVSTNFSYGSYPSAPAWWYFQEGYTFQNPPLTSNPYSGANISNVPSNGLGDYGVFYGVKVGDVNLSCNCNAFKPEYKDQTEEQEASIIIGTINAQRKKSIISVPVLLSSPFPVMAAQTGLRFDASLIGFVQVIPNISSGVNIQQFGTTRAQDGELRFVWFSEDDESTLQNGDLLFTLEFDLPEGAVLPQEPWLWTSDAILPSIVYNASGDQREIPWRLVWADKRQELAPIGLALSPNPFQENASAFINMPSAGDALMQIQDARGKIRAIQRLELVAGENQVQIQASDIPPGVYMLSVDAMGQRVTRRIVKL